MSDTITFDDLPDASSITFDDLPDASSIGFDDLPDDGESGQKRGFFGNLGASARRGLETGLIEAPAALYGAGGDDAARRSAAEAIANRQIAAPDFEGQEDVNKMGEQLRSGQYLAAAKTLLMNPLDVFGNLAAEGLGSSAVPLALGAAGAGAGTLAAPGVGTIAGGAVGLGTGSGLVEAGSTILDTMGSKGIDLTNADQIYAAFNDPALMAEAKDRALKRGVAVGVFDAATAGLAGRLLAGARNTLGSKLARGAGEVGIQAAGGAGGDIAGQLLTDGRVTDVASPVFEAIGEIGGGAPEIVAGARIRGRAEQEAPPLEGEQEQTPPPPPATPLDPTTLGLPPKEGNVSIRWTENAEPDFYQVEDVVQGDAEPIVRLRTTREGGSRVENFLWSDIKDLVAPVEVTTDPGSTSPKGAPRAEASITTKGPAEGDMPPAPPLSKYEAQASQVREPDAQIKNLTDQEEPDIPPRQTPPQQSLALPDNALREIEGLQSLIDRNEDRLNKLPDDSEDQETQNLRAGILDTIERSQRKIGQLRAQYTPKQTVQAGEPGGVRQPPPLPGALGVAAQKPGFVSAAEVPLPTDTTARQPLDTGPAVQKPAPTPTQPTLEQGMAGKQGLEPGQKLDTGPDIRASAPTPTLEGLPLAESMKGKESFAGTGKSITTPMTAGQKEIQKKLELQRNQTVKKPETLLQALKRIGIRKGDPALSDIDKSKLLPGTIVTRKGDKRGIGRTLADIHQVLEQDGFIEKRRDVEQYTSQDINTLKEAIDQDFAGKNPVWAAIDQEQGARWLEQEKALNSQKEFEAQWGPGAVGRLRAELKTKFNVDTEPKATLGELQRRLNKEIEDAETRVAEADNSLSEKQKNDLADAFLIDRVTPVLDADARAVDEDTPHMETAYEPFDLTEAQDTDTRSTQSRVGAETAGLQQTGAQSETAAQGQERGAAENVVSESVPEGDTTAIEDEDNADIAAAVAAAGVKRAPVRQQSSQEVSEILSKRFREEGLLNTESHETSPVLAPNGKLYATGGEHQRAADALYDSDEENVTFERAAIEKGIVRTQGLYQTRDGGVGFGIQIVEGQPLTQQQKSSIMRMAREATVIYGDVVNSNGDVINTLSTREQINTELAKHSGGVTRQPMKRAPGRGYKPSEKGGIYVGPKRQPMRRGEKSDLERKIAAIIDAINKRITKALSKQNMLNTTARVNATVPKTTDNPYNPGWDLSAASQLTTFMSGVAAKDQHVGLYHQKVQDKHKFEHGMIKEGEDRLRAAFDLPDSSRKKINAVMEHDRLMGVDRTNFKARVAVIIPENYKGDLGKPGQRIELSRAETDALRDIRGYLNDRFDQELRTYAQGVGYDGALDVDAVQKQIEATDDKKQRARLELVQEKIQNTIKAKRMGYVPFRRYGDVRITVNPELRAGVDADEKLEKTRVVHVETRPRWEFLYTGRADALRKYQKEQVDKAIAELRKKYPEGKYKIGVQKVEENPFEGISIEDLEQLGSAMAKLNDPQTADDIFEKVVKQMKRQMAASYKHMSENVPGYSTDFFRALADHNRVTSVVAAQQRFGMDVKNAYDAVQKNSGKNTKAFVERYHNYLDSDEAIIGRLKQFGFWANIWGSPSSALVNLFQTPTITAAQIAAWGGRGGYGRTLKLLLSVSSAMRVNKDGATLDFNKIKMTPDERKAFMAAVKAGTIDPGVAQDLMGDEPNKFGQKRETQEFFGRVFKVGSSMFNSAEQINRAVAWLSAYREIQRPGAMQKFMKMYAKDERVQTLRRQDRLSPADIAEFVTNDTQFIGGKFDRPEAMRGVGGVVFQFKTYPLNYMRLLYGNFTRMGPEGKVAGMIMLATMLGLSGLLGLPFAEDALNVADAIGKFLNDGVDPMLEREMRQFMSDLGWSTEGAEAVLRGPSRMLGVDLSKRLGMGEVAPDADLMMSIPILGATYGRMDEFYNRQRTGQPIGAAIAAAAPIVGKGPADLARGLLQVPEEGVRTKYGDTRIFPSETTAGQAAAKALGFQPATFARKQEEAFMDRRLERKTRDAETALRSKLSGYLADSIVARRTGDTERANEMLAKYRAAYKDAYEAFRNEKVLEDKISVPSQQVVSKRAREMADERLKIKSAPKNKRAALAEQQEDSLVLED